MSIAQIRTLIIAAQANDIVVSRLILGANRCFLAQNIEQQDQTIIRVPGALEIPLALKKAAQCQSFDIFVVLGSIIKGQTDHYDHVARLANDGVLSVALEFGLALGNGIQTLHNIEQAFARADGPYGNLGFDAAQASLSLWQTFNNLNKEKRQK